MKTPPLWRSVEGPERLQELGVNFPSNGTKVGRGLGEGGSGRAPCSQCLGDRQAQPLLHLAAGLPLTHACSRACSLPEISMQHPDAASGTVCDFYFCCQRSNEVHAAPVVYISADVSHNIILL